MSPMPPPLSEAELIVRARALAGMTMAELGRAIARDVPCDLRRHKGWVGQAVELALGATASSRDVPDFEAIGVELKTLPVDESGKPVESTFVCTIELREIGTMPWECSRAWRKLARVLWVPILGERRVPLPERRIGGAFLWSPSPSEERVLRADWEELAGLIGRGGIESITAHLGASLQVRPKAASSRVRRRAVDAEGLMSDTLPRGFYLRTSFTAAILRENVRLPR